MAKLVPAIRDASPWLTSALLILVGLVIATILALIDMSWALVVGVMAAFLFGAVIAHRRRSA
jgi:hypothetical protein